jgi:hypothetical protein
LTAGDVIHHAVVAPVVKRAGIAKLHPGKGHAGPGVVGGFSVVLLDLILPLAVAGDKIADLGFAPEAKANVGSIAIGAFIVREIVQAVDFTKQI